MVRRLRFTAALLGAGFAAGLIAAPESFAGDGRSQRDDKKSDDRSGKGDWKRDKDDSFPDRFKDRLDDMSPEERKHFEENWQKWKEMGEREREDWQRRAAEARKRMEKAVDDTLVKLELKLDDDAREVFALRYRQERKKIEKELCQKMDEERKVMVDAMLQNLKNEFSSGKPVAAEVSAAPEKPAPAGSR